jgi:hypothetical protein
VAGHARAGLASDPDGYFCAVEEGQIRGMVSALVRGRVWYLSMFVPAAGEMVMLAIANSTSAPDLTASPSAPHAPGAWSAAPMLRLLRPASAVPVACDESFFRPVETAIGPAASYQREGGPDSDP